MRFFEDLELTTILILLTVGAVIVYKIFKGGGCGAGWLCDYFDYGCPAGCSPATQNPPSAPSQTGAITEGGLTGILASGYQAVTNFDDLVSNAVSVNSGQSAVTAAAGGNTILDQQATF